MVNIKQILLSVILLAVAFALIIGVVIPLLEHGAGTGNEAIIQGRIVLSKVGNLLE